MKSSILLHWASISWVPNPHSALQPVTGYY